MDRMIDGVVLKTLSMCVCDELMIARNLVLAPLLSGLLNQSISDVNGVGTLDTTHQPEISSRDCKHMCKSI